MWGIYVPVPQGPLIPPGAQGGGGIVSDPTRRFSSPTREETRCRGEVA